MVTNKTIHTEHCDLRSTTHDLFELVITQYLSPIVGVLSRQWWNERQTRKKESKMNTENEKVLARNS